MERDFYSLIGKGRFQRGFHLIFHNWRPVSVPADGTGGWAGPHEALEGLQTAPVEHVRAAQQHLVALLEG